MKSHQLQRGFTLIELMIVVAIIAILAAIAIPAYQDYLIRAQVSEGFVMLDGAKTAMSEFYANNGRFPGNNQSAGLASDTSIKGSYVNGVSVSYCGQGIICAAFNTTKANKAIQGQFIALSAITGAGSISWSCGLSNVGAAGGLVPDKYLPSSCRH